MGYKAFVAGQYKIRERNGKYYVYLIEKDEKGKVKETYIGPLVDVVEAYIKLKESNGGVGALPPHSRARIRTGVPGARALDLASLSEPTSLSIEEEIKDFAPNDVGVTRGKTRSEIPSGLELIAFFKDCIKSASEETCRQYVNYLRKPITSAKNSILAWKKYYKWKGDLEAWKSLKTKKSGVDLKVPDIAEIKRELEAVRGTQVELVFRLLLESGVRLREAVKVLSEYDEKNEINENDFYIYTLNWVRGSKKVFYVFHITPLRKIGITYDYAKKLLHERGIAPKYIRKFVATKMAELGISSEIIDFIQGRTPSSILTKHYLNLLALAKSAYKKYAEWLRTSL